MVNILVGRLLKWLLPGNHAHGQFPSLDVNWTYTLLQMNIKQQKWWDVTSKFRLQRLGLTSCQHPFSCWHSRSLSLDFLAYSFWGIKLSCWRGSHGKGITRLSPASSQWGIEVLSPRPHEEMNLFPNLISELGNMPFPVDPAITASLANALLPVRDSEAEVQGFCTCVPDPQQLWGNIVSSHSALGYVN